MEPISLQKNLVFISNIQATKLEKFLFFFHEENRIAKVFGASIESLK